MRDYKINVCLKSPLSVAQLNEAIQAAAALGDAKAVRSLLVKTCVPAMRLAIQKDPEGVNIDIVAAGKKAVKGHHRETLQVISRVCMPEQLFEILTQITNTHPVEMAHDLLAYLKLDASSAQNLPLIRSLSEAEMESRGITPLMRALYPHSNIPSLLKDVMAPGGGWNDLVDPLIRLAIEMEDSRVESFMTKKVAKEAPIAASFLAARAAARDRANKANSYSPVLAGKSRSRIRP